MKTDNNRNYFKLFHNRLVTAEALSRILEPIIGRKLEFENKKSKDFIPSTSVVHVDNTLEVKFKKVNPEASIPCKEHRNDAGWDLKATTCEYDEKIDCFIYGTGLAMEIPTGYVGLVFPRSSNRKKDVYLTNHVGVIDSTYRGEVMASFKYRDHREADNAYPYEIGDKICQIIIVPYPEIKWLEASELSATDRGKGGHGSTGK